LAGDWEEYIFSWLFIAVLTMSAWLHMVSGLFARHSVWPLFQTANPPVVPTRNPLLFQLENTRLSGEIQAVHALEI
jgi:hypothetical protein